MKIGATPAAGVQVRLSETDNRWAPDEAMPITQAQQLKTDSRGRYAFERVIPGRLSVSRIFTLERSSFHVGTGCRPDRHGQTGQDDLVDLGGSGRPVIGRFVLPAGIKAAPSSPTTTKPWSGSVPNRLIPRISAAKTARRGSPTGWRPPRARLIPPRSRSIRTSAPTAASGSRTFPPASTGSTPKVHAPGNGSSRDLRARAREHRHRDRRPRGPRRPLRCAAGRRHDRAQARQRSRVQLIDGERISTRLCPLRSTLPCAGFRRLASKLARPFIDDALWADQNLRRARVRTGDDLACASIAFAPALKGSSDGVRPSRQAGHLCQLCLSRRRHVPRRVAGLVTDFVKWLQFRLDQLLGVRDACRLWMDVQLPKNARLDASLEQQVRDCAVIIVILSEGYLKSEWCGKELADFLEEEIARRSSSGSPIFVVELSNLTRPPALAQLETGRPAVLGDGY